MFHLVLWNNCMRIVLVELILLDEVEVFCQGLHQSLLSHVYSCISKYFYEVYNITLCEMFQMWDPKMELTLNNRNDLIHFEGFLNKWNVEFF